MRRDYLDPAQSPAASAATSSLLEALPTEHRDLLTGSAAVGDAARRELDMLWCWFHDHRAHGYLRPGRKTFNRQSASTPEARWVNLIKAAAALYDGLQHHGFDTQAHIGIGSYSGHSAQSYDIELPIRTPILVAPPAELRLGRQVLGEDSGAPLGRYALRRSVFAAADPSTPSRSSTTSGTRATSAARASPASGSARSRPSPTATNGRRRTA